MRNPKEMYVDGEYLIKNPTWDIEDSPWKARQIMKIIEKNSLQPKSICEVGCGAGEILNQLYIKMDTTCSFVGYEISPQAFDLCQQKTKERLQYHLGDLFVDEEATFDLVLAIDLIEHIEDYFTFLENLREKGKYFIFHITLDLSVQTVLRSSPLVRGRESVGHIHYFTKETALATLNDTGYRILDHFYAAGSIDLPAKHFKTLLARLPRRMFYKLNKDIAVRIFGGYELLVLAA